MFNIYATDYAPVDPIIPPCDITPIFIGYKGENKARCLIFDLTDCVETFGDGGFVISFIRQGDDLPYLVTDTDRLDNNAIWIITDTDTAVDGYGMVQMQYIVDDVVCKSALYRTVTFDSNGITGDVPDPYEDLLAQIAAYAAQAEGAATTATAAAQTATTAVENGIVTERSQRIAADEGLNTRINELMGLAGAPSMANSAAAMTDSSKVYVYTGSEAGYLTGHWYYYNGTEWADGGVYQATAVDTDKTLTVENMAADAAVTGERIDECMAAFVTKTASGSIASFDDGADGVPVKDLVVNITPKQASGTPSPTNVLPITGWAEANIYGYGKNVFNVPDVSASTQNTTIFNVDASESLPTDNWVISFDVVNATCENATAALFDLYDASNYNFYYPTATQIGRVTDGVIFSTLTQPVTGRFYFRVRGHSIKTIKLFLRSDAYGWWGGTFKNFQLERGDAPTDYEPYNGNTYNISFGSAGTVYGGTLDVTSGMLTVDSVFYSLTGGFTAYGDYYGNQLYQYTLPNAVKVYAATGSAAKRPYCNMYNATTGITGPAMDNNEFRTSAGNGVSTPYIFVRDDALSSVAELNTRLATTPMQLVLEMVNPISYQLTATEVRTLLANNNIWSDTGSVASCEYRADTGILITKLTNAIISLGGNV